MDVYLSSNTKRRQKIKDICKEYQNLPSDIVKQIIDWKLSKEKKTINEAFKEYYCLVYEEKSIENAVKQAIKGHRIEGNPYIYDLIIFVDVGNEGFSYRLTVWQAVKRLEVIRDIKREIIREARINHVTRPFLRKSE
jgi:hypothetical protein